MSRETAHSCERDTLTLAIGDDVPLSFCWIPPARSLMGSPEYGRRSRRIRVAATPRRDRPRVPHVLHADYP